MSFIMWTLPLAYGNLNLKRIAKAIPGIDHVEFKQKPMLRRNKMKTIYERNFNRNKST